MCRQKISCDKKVERVPIYRILQKTIQTIVREYYPSIFVIIIIVLNQKKKMVRFFIVIDRNGFHFGNHWTVNRIINDRVIFSSGNESYSALVFLT